MLVSQVNKKKRSRNIPDTYDLSLRISIWFSRTGWPTKMSPFFFGNNFYKNKETFKIFSPQVLEVYRIFLVQTTLESIMFYCTFSVINTMFVPCTALLYEQNSNNKIVQDFIEHFLCNPPDFFSDDVLYCQ